jgi:LPS sulfotransferase NodH
MQLPSPRRYVILSTPRTGSSHLVGALEAHPHVACLGELFNLNGGAMRQLGIHSQRVIDMAKHEPLAYLQELIGLWSKRAETKPVFGFKMMLHHDPRVIEYLVRSPEWKVILLRRDNTLAQWSSLQLAKVTGEWSSKGKNKRAAAGIPEPETLVEFQPHAFQAYCDRIEARYASIKRRVADHALFEVSTETIDARRDEILAFLGVDPRLAPLVETAGQRQNSSSLEMRFSNRDEVTRYARKHGLVMTA